MHRSVLRIALACIWAVFIENSMANQVLFLSKNASLIKAGCYSEEDFGKPKGFDGKQLHRKHLNIGVLESKPFLFFDPSARDVQHKNLEHAHGYIKHLIIYLANQLGFSYKIIVYNQFGKEEPANSGNWTGAFGAIVKKEVDVLAVDIMMTANRNRYMDFSGPFTYSHQRLFVSLTQSYVAINWTVFLQPFTWSVWLILLANISIAAIFLKVATKVATRNQIKRPSWISIGFDVWGIFIQQDATDIPRDIPSISSKIILSVVSLMSMIIFSCYSSILTSATTVAQQPWIVKTVSDVLDRSDYKIGLQKDSTFIDVLQRSDSGIYRDIWQRVQKYNTANVVDFESALQIMNGDNFAYVNTEYKFNAITNGSCKYAILKDKLYQQSLHFAFQKGSNLTKIFTATIHKMRQYGILDKLEESQGLTMKTRHCKDAQGTTMEPVQLSAMASTFVAVIIGIPLAITILFIEKCIP